MINTKIDILKEGKPYLPKFITCFVDKEDQEYYLVFEDMKKIVFNEDIH